MSSFALAIPTILKHEGGLVDNAADPGGITNYGVSIRFALSELTKDGDGDGFLDGDFDHDGDVDADDIRKMTPEQASSVYLTHFWNKYHLDLIDQQDVATKVFDMAVNMGGKQAGKILQRAANRYGTTLVVDGAIGSKTFQAVNRLGNHDLMGAIRAEQKAFYEDLIVAHPKLIVFRNGWLNRAAA